MSRPRRPIPAGVFLWSAVVERSVDTAVDEVEEMNLNPAVEPLEIGGSAFIARGYEIDTCHRKGELRSSWISYPINGLRRRSSFNCRN